MKRHDVLVIGAGPAGSTAAILLARAGWDVAVAEKARFPRRKVCGEYISAGSWPLLAELGVAQAVAAHAGPPVTRVGFWAAGEALATAMPHVGEDIYGRAIGREHLDTILLDRARACGATVLEDTAIHDVDKGFARTLIAAHGAWESGSLPTQVPRRAASARDLLGFKAHFRNARLDAGLMPLVVFPGGYGGMVATDSGRVSLSCCVRRETLERVRRRHRGSRAGEALLAHIVENNRAVRGALEVAEVEGGWLSAGPIRPAIRRFRKEGVFVVGNAAGEAHPIVAEGISMAIQSSFLLCEALLAEDADRYERAWRRNFAARVHAAAAFAAVLTHPLGSAAARAILERLPRVLALGARASGKARVLQPQ